MLNPIKQGFEWIASQITEAGTTTDILNKIKGFFGQIAVNVADAVSRYVPQAGIFVMQIMLGLAKEVREDVVNLVLTYINLTTRVTLTRDDIRELTPSAISEAFQKAFTTHPMHYMLDLIKPDAPITPERGIEAAENFMNVNMAFQIDAWIMHFIADVTSFGFIKSFKDLPNAISWSFGIGWLSWLVMGTPFRIFIAEPQEWYWNYIYMPKRFNERELAQNLILDRIRGKDYEEEMRYLGWSQDKSWFLYDLYSDKPTFSQVRDLYYNTDIGEEGVETLLKWLGWNWKFRKYALTLIKNERLWDLQEDLEQEVLRAYREDRLTREQATSILQDRGWNRTEIETALTVQDLIAQRRRDLPLSTIDKAYEYGLISDEKWWEYYLRAGYTPEDIQLILSIRQFEKTLEEANRVYWARRQELTSKLHDAGVEDYWFIAADELGTDRQSIIRIGTMSEQEWIKLMNKIIEKYR